MSFLDKLTEKRSRLAPTRTLVTRADGKRFVEQNGRSEECVGTKAFGFVVDTKPDKTPARILEHLYLGSQDAADAGVLREHEITRVLSVGITVALDDAFTTKHLPCLDLPDTRLERTLPDAFDFIDDAIAAKRNVLVHCNAGVSRAPTIVIAYLMRRRRMPFDEAYAHVKALRPSARPNDGFVRQLRALVHN